MAKDIKPSRLGAVIAAKRKQLGYSQRQLAEKVDLNNATISKLEKDPSLTPDVTTLRKLAETLGLDYNYLLMLNETIDDDSDMRLIARAKSRMNTADQARMMDMLKTTFHEAFADAGDDGIDEADLL